MTIEKPTETTLRTASPSNEEASDAPEPANAEPVNAESVNAESVNAEPLILEPADAEPANEGPGSEDVEPSLAVETELATPPNDNGFQQLDPRSIGLEKLQSIIASGIIGVIAAGAGTPVMLFASFPAQVIVPLVWIAIGIFVVIVTFWWPHWEYDRWSYRINDKVVELRHGVIWHVAVSIPLSRLQHVDLHRGPLERRRGLASLELHTAGTRDASHTIHGLDVEVATKLRDRLIDVTNRGSDVAAHG